MSPVWGERIAEYPQTSDRNPTAPPLVVDLDGTLVKTDLLIESLLDLARRQPWCLFLLPLWLARGKARFKHEIARRVSLDVALLPWRSEFIEYLRQQRAEGRSLVLATATDREIAQQVADHLALFDLVLAADGNTNFCGEAKRKRLVALFGENAFDYAADGCGRSENDLVVWQSARKAILVNPESRLRKAVAKVAGIDRVFADPQTGFSARLNALRPLHWLKNLLVFVPLIAAHRIHDMASLEKSLLAFVALGCFASSGYLFNDLIDIEADRHHPQKRFRPFAAGTLPVSYALITGPVLLMCGALLGLLISPMLLAILVVYLAMSAAYTLLIKRIAVLDVLFLAGLYTLRLTAGSAAAGIWPSHWLLAFSIFLFFSLALVKRYSELVVMQHIEGNGAKARSYEFSDGELLAAMGTASGYLAVLVLALYIASDKAQVLYGRPELLWFLCPLLLYWISYVWLSAHRGKMHHDPVVFALRDRTSQILIFLMAFTATVAL